MSKAVLISIHPEWCKLIANGKKTVEIRKSFPKLPVPFKCYIYETKGATRYHSRPMPIIYHEGRGMVIGEFVCNVILRHCEMANADIAEIQGLVRRDKIQEYANGKEVFGWHISDLVIYDTPKELGEFQKPSDPNCFWYRDVSMKRPPQSWCYVEELPEGGAGNG